MADMEATVHNVAKIEVRERQHGEDSETGPFKVVTIRVVRSNGQTFNLECFTYDLGLTVIDYVTQQD